MKKNNFVENFMGKCGFESFKVMTKGGLLDILNNDDTSLQISEKFGVTFDFPCVYMFLKIYTPQDDDLASNDPLIQKWDIITGNEFLYVGITDNFLVRMKDHMEKEGDFIDKCTHVGYMVCENEQQRKFIEKQLLRIMPFGWVYNKKMGN